ncbi:MAG: carbohydrate porin [Merismopedia sp. SIO2A8]|nr:carbohydrate porin [Merismopedia sp. SIO2A8]
MSTPTTNLGQIPPTQVPPEISSKPINSPSLSFQGSYITQGEDSVARARLSGIYPVTPQILFGATFDLTSEDNELADSPEDGFNINELYLAAAPFKDLPNLRFVVGQLDLTSYFDRNSFAKDGVSHFFNSVFQTNPALSATGIASRTGALVNWSVTDNIEAKAAVFSSDRALDDFDLDGFAGEIGLRFGNAIVRGTYATARDAGSDTGFQEIFSLSRGDNDFGLEPEDREESYGINAEVFIPNLNMGLFARYGRYENRELDEGADTYSLGLTFLDVFAKDDRLGLAYGRGLSNERLRQDNDDDLPDVLELFYDFRFLRNLRLGVTLQQRDNFSDTFAGFRIKTDFDLIRRRRGGQ